MSQLSEIVQALLTPRAYPEPTRKVEMAQTQMSFIFFTDNHAYKVKKPVDLGYLDYTTLEKRHLFCQKEVELNQRLCPRAYLGVVPITQSQSGIRIGGDGEVIEYAVKMLKLPQERMMNVLLTQNQVSAGMITSVAKRVAAFHQKAETKNATTAFGGVATIIKNTEENFSQTEKYIGIAVTPEQYQRIVDYTRRFNKENTKLFNKSIAEGKIRDCHGDHHTAHICFTDGICIYDCIEFNDRFRYYDVASEVSFLAMDLDHYGRSDLSRSFVDAYVSESQDKEIPKLLDFYKCYFSIVRAKVACFQLDDPFVPEAEKTKILNSARSYFELAESYTRE